MSSRDTILVCWILKRIDHPKITLNLSQILKHRDTQHSSPHPFDFCHQVVDFSTMRAVPSRTLRSNPRLILNTHEEQRSSSSASSEDGWTQDTR